MALYNSFGELVYEVLNAKGDKMKKVDTKEIVRRIKDPSIGGMLYPRVSDILAMWNKPSLNKWVKEQGILAALTTDRLEHEDDVAFMRRLEDDSNEARDKAAEAGTVIHNYLQQLINNEETEDIISHPYIISSDAYEYLAEYLYKNYDIDITLSGCRIETEVPLVNTELGYAGTCDCIINSGTSQPIYLDYKTKNNLANKNKGDYVFTENGQQLVAYALTRKEFDNAILINVYIDRETGHTEFHEWVEGNSKLHGKWRKSTQKKLFINALNSYHLMRDIDYSEVF